MREKGLRIEKKKKATWNSFSEIYEKKEPELWPVYSDTVTEEGHLQESKGNCKFNMRQYQRTRTNQRQQRGGREVMDIGEQMQKNALKQTRDF